ncbi:MAG TPA: hypothetical protein VGZ91_02920 [Candidatus Sulfotelmatobacter sp.]|nr:hypothetical protein [Candidatus Sulfotelmatobacter sp.]
MATLRMSLAWRAVVNGQWSAAGGNGSGVRARPSDDPDQDLLA